MATRITALVIMLLISWTTLAQTADVLEKKIADQPDNIAPRVKLAEIYISEGKFEKAADLLNAYTDQLPKTGFRALAFAYSSLNKYDDEVRVLNIISKKDDDNHEWHMLLGQAYIKQAASFAKNNDEVSQRQLTLGIQQLRRTLKLQPKYKPAYDLLLKTFIDQKSNSEARELLIEGIQSFGRRAELFRELCRIDSNDGFLVQAVTNCSESISISPRYPDHYVFLIQALYDQKEELKAEKYAVSAAKKFRDSEFVQWAAGTLFLRKKNYAVASRYFQAAVKAAPESGRAHYGLAQSLYESGKEEASLEHFIKACKTIRESQETFFAAGGRLKQAGNMKLGGTFISKASTCR